MLTDRQPLTAKKYLAALGILLLIVTLCWIVAIGLFFTGAEGLGASLASGSMLLAVGTASAMKRKFILSRENGSPVIPDAVWTQIVWGALALSVLAIAIWIISSGE